MIAALVLFQPVFGKTDISLSETQVESMSEASHNRARAVVERALHVMGAPEAIRAARHITPYLETNGRRNLLSAFRCGAARVR